MKGATPAIRFIKKQLSGREMGPVNLYTER